MTCPENSPCHRDDIGGSKSGDGLAAALLPERPDLWDNEGIETRSAKERKMAAVRE
ncbi:hypothetical protein THTE_0001 [Thermogutta terrifontis]|uniref:Uncharacterized protein n=1 Tax=Thermogutta terrifontis TaxID=1331910 RepID=A0A286R9H4_9BACT|nr:hypothetical protein THTE_0001 [Thermogutta terrifontis]